MKHIDYLIERANRRTEYFRRRRSYLKEIKRLARRMVPGARVFLFGSVARGDFWINSDIDVLIVSPSMPKKTMERSKLSADIHHEIGYGSPFEFHLVTPSEMKWYDRFIDKKIEVA
ncbi:MAG: nucleotidyltransferase domain-containing protein [Nitrospirae bacterium]|nr:nucleotidyltransferase domain-containing protein [Nitrospirota bacterium]